MTSDETVILDDLTRGEDNASFVRLAMARLTRGLNLNDPTDAASWLALLRRLYQAGRYDLALGRLFEGHVDALQIIGRYADAPTRARFHAAARNGASFGVWNAPLPGQPLTLHQGRLSGGKSFASGAGILSHALVTLNAGDSDRVELLVLDLTAVPPAVETDWWHTVGMQHSETHRVRWRGELIDSAARIGAPGDYERLPWFATGALRFVAVQAGGIAAIFDAARDHLIAADRAGDTHQCVRLSHLFGLAETAAAVCHQTAVYLSVDNIDQQVARVAYARTTVADLGEQAIMLAQQAVGLQGLFTTHPLAIALTDLMVYLRQPGPDAQRMRVGEASGSGVLTPTL